MKFLKIGLIAMCVMAFQVQAEQAEVKITGLVCPLCFSKVEKKFKENAAIQDVKVEMEKKSLLVQFKEGQTLTDDEIKKIIDKDSGYVVSDVKRLK